MSARLWIGGESWQCKDWAGVFYSEGVKPKDMLTEYARVFNAVAVDATFYGMPRATSVEEWRARTPDDFRFAMKVPRRVTHQLRFREADSLFAVFLERARLLGPKLGPILIQCPPDFGPTPGNRRALFEFLESQLPDDIKFALELRDQGWYDDQLFAFARTCGFALAAAESEHSPMPLTTKIIERHVNDPPADFIYLRFMGDTEFAQYNRKQFDRGASLAAWVPLIQSLRAKLADVFAFVSNDYEGYAPATIRDLLARLGEALPPETTAPRLL